MRHVPLTHALFEMQLGPLVLLHGAPSSAAGMHVPLASPVGTRQNPAAAQSV